MDPTDEKTTIPRSRSESIAEDTIFGRRRRNLLRWFKGGMGSPAPGTQLLPVLIQVFAGFSKLDGEIVAEDIDSSLGFLRYDYPEAVHSELQRLYQKALQEDQDLNEVAAQLAAQLTVEQKVLLGIQLYLLISRAHVPKTQLVQFYRFMTNLGVATEAIDIVYQLNPANT